MKVIAIFRAHFRFVTDNVHVDERNPGLVYGMRSSHFVGMR